MLNGKRFSKSNLLEELVRRRDALQSEYKFDPKNGYAQVVNSPIQRVLAYGRYTMLCDIISEL